MDLCVKFRAQSKPTNPMTGWGVSSNSGGKAFASEGTVTGCIFLCRLLTLLVDIHIKFNVNDTHTLFGVVFNWINCSEEKMHKFQSIGSCSLCLIWNLEWQYISKERLGWQYT